MPRAGEEHHYTLAGGCLFEACQEVCLCAEPFSVQARPGTLPSLCVATLHLHQESHAGKQSGNIPTQMSHYLLELLYTWYKPGRLRRDTMFSMHVQYTRIHTMRYLHCCTRSWWTSSAGGYWLFGSPLNFL